jgi:methionine synthase I (cobalamin-dependent)
MRKLAEGGVWGIGGCCGTTPAHIELVSALAKG